ncbi:MAG: carboxypeptidase-like regulatory domain-containing protein, partial [Bacteroidota bacterium]
MVGLERESNPYASRQLLELAALLFTGFLLSPAFAQTPTLVRGTIIDALTHKPISIVNVVVTNTPYGAATDSAGYFELRNLPPNLYVLEFRHVAYRKRIHIFTLKPSEHVTFTVELDEEPVKLQEVEITARPEEMPRLQQTY